MQPDPGIPPFTASLPRVHFINHGLRCRAPPACPPSWTCRRRWRLFNMPC